MKSLIVAIALFTLSAPAFSQRSNHEAAVLETVRAFYAAFNSHGFDHSTEFTTDDWNHINPYGGRTRGRMKVLKELHAVHGSFLNGVSDNIEQPDVRFASKEVAVATVASRMRTFTSPDRVKTATDPPTTTVVLVHRAWR